MSWIGLRDRHESLLAPDGLDRPNGALPDLDAVLPCGTLQLECRYERMPVDQTLFDLCETNPWPSAMSLHFDVAGNLHFTHRLADQSIQAFLPTQLTSPAKNLALSYAWDAPARQAVLSLFDPNMGQIWQTQISNPMPVSLRDIARILDHASAVALSADVRWVGVSDQIEPCGPMPSLDGRLRVAMQSGTCAVRDLRPGMQVETTDGLGAQIRWVGYADVIARGHQAPVLMRAPYHGLHRDVIVSPQQRIRLRGSQVEYLFGEEEVSALALHLRNERSVQMAPRQHVVRYYQMVLDRNAVMLVEGAPMESLNIAAIVLDRGVLAHSVLRDLPVELLPMCQLQDRTELHGFEAMTLAHAALF